MYISSPGSSPAAMVTGKVLVSFTPNSTPFSSHSAIRRRNIGIASENCRSALK